MPLTSSSSARSRPSRPARRQRPGRQWVGWLLAGGLLLGLGLYGRYSAQLNRYARRAYASLRAGSLTGHEQTPFRAGYAVHGIDVSAYQGRIDWPLVASHEVRFAFIKATEGGTLRDPRFGRNWRGARAAGVFRGAYHYFHPNSDATRQADLFTRTVPLGPGDLPPVLDVEHANFHDVAQMRRGVALWLRLVERHYGVRPIMYSNYGFYQRHLAGHFDKYPLWLAHYDVDQPRLPASRWIIWQHSDESYVPGVRGLVDFNVFQGSFERLRDLRIPPKRP